jgi:tRNA pseudouridine synthase 10
MLNALFVKGEYLKYVRKLPQTKWDCYDCHGAKINPKTQKPCETCQGTGRIYDTSIEEIFGPYLATAAGGNEFVFHGAGREDFDVRCLGKGRPFILEIKNPKKRRLDLETIRQKINADHGAEIELTSLRPADKADVVVYKSSASEGVKVYHALITTSNYIDEDLFNEKFKLLQDIYSKRNVNQRTPLRVVRRRADMTRQKKIYSVDGNYIDPLHFFARIKADSGTYLKELISGDDGRTYPSFASIFGIPLLCVELDVVEIDDEPKPKAK